MLKSTDQHRSLVGLHGFKFFNKYGDCILTAGFWGNESCVERDFLLEPGERVIGIHSRIETRYENQAIHRDFQFILGKLIKDS